MKCNIASQSGVGIQTQYFALYEMKRILESANFTHLTEYYKSGDEE